ncbi:hypothetical protein D3C78_720650 [compost metagenome]
MAARPDRQSISGGITPKDTINPVESNPIRITCRDGAPLSISKHHLPIIISNIRYSKVINSPYHIHWHLIIGNMMSYIEIGICLLSCPGRSIVRNRTKFHIIIAFIYPNRGEKFEGFLRLIHINPSIFRKKIRLRAVIYVKRKAHLLDACIFQIISIAVS